MKKKLSNKWFLRLSFSVLFFFCLIPVARALNSIFFGLNAKIGGLWVLGTTTGAPTCRLRHTAAWTGSNMIVWGGDTFASENTFFNTSTTMLGDGGIYNPSNDTWLNMTSTNAPAARSNHTAVWTGSKMLIWGGSTAATNPPDCVNTGGVYDPSTDTWTAISTVGAPSARCGHAAVWTGSKMLIWGGSNGWENTFYNDGALYDPGTDTWTAISNSGAPSAAARMAYALIGSKLVVWGGEIASGPVQTNTGGVYNLIGDSWSTMSTANAPSARRRFSFSASGGQLFVWSGSDGSDLVTGGIYDVVSDTWTATDTVNTPYARRNAQAVWIGSSYVVVGGIVASGYSGICAGDHGSYDPVSSRWQRISATKSPCVSGGHTAIWTGSKIISWGGYINNGLSTGCEAPAVWTP